MILHVMMIVLIALMNGHVSEFVAEAMANVAIGVFHKYHSTCIYLLSVSNREELSHWQRATLVQKSLSRRKITNLVISVENLGQFVRGTFCRPLIILLQPRAISEDLSHEISDALHASNVTWLLFADNNEPIEEFFTKIQIPFNCIFLVAKIRTISSVSEVYHLPSLKSLQKVEVATWNMAHGFKWSPALPFYERRGNLQGTVVKGAVIPYKPYLLSNSENSKEPRFSGYLMQLWKELERRMNFKTEFIVLKDGVFGFLLENGSWNGAVGMVQREEADVGISFFAYLKDRLSAVDFLPPIWNVKLMVHIKEPELEVSKFSHIMSPFVPSLWFIVVFCMVVFTALLSFTWYLRPKDQDSFDSTLYNIWESSLYVFGAFCQQGHDSTPRSPSCRLIYLMTYLLAVVMFVMYSAIFISFLTIKRYNLPFDDFDGLLNDGSYEFGVLSGSARINYFKKSPDENLRRLYWKLLDPELPKQPVSDVDGLRRICNEKKYSYLISGTTLRGLARNIPCSIVGVPHAYYTITASMIISKSSPYQRLFHHHVQEIRRSGILDRIERSSWPPKYEEILLDPPSSVSLETVTIFLIVLAIGILSAVAVLFLEIAAYKFRIWRLLKSKTPY
ncbi:Ionotropic receptor 160 [Blattella germanica]|nr:Ionotropic receptor 160 [Blattella germanica]